MYQHSDIFSADHNCGASLHAPQNIVQNLNKIHACVVFVVEWLVGWFLFVFSFSQSAWVIIWSTAPPHRWHQMCRFEASPRQAWMVMVIFRAVNMQPSSAGTIFSYIGLATYSIPISILVSRASPLLHGGKSLVNWVFKCCPQRTGYCAPIRAQYSVMWDVGRCPQHQFND